MFTSKRHMTRGIHESLGLEIQIFLWAMIDQRKRTGIEVDYLQVFELSIEQQFGVSRQKVIQRQECPPLKEVCYLPITMDEPVDLTVWAIDNEECSMMMLPNEY